MSFAEPPRGTKHGTKKSLAMPGRGGTAMVLVRLRRTRLGITITGTLFAIAFPRQRRLDALLLAGLQVECVALGVLDDFFLKNFALKSFKRALQTLAFM